MTDLLCNGQDPKQLQLPGAVGLQGDRMCRECEWLSALQDRCMTGTVTGPDEMWLLQQLCWLLAAGRHCNQTRWDTLAAKHGV